MNFPSPVTITALFTSGSPVKQALLGPCSPEMAGATKGTSVRQVSTQYMLTTEQAQVLVGEKLCVFEK